MKYIRKGSTDIWWTRSSVTSFSTGNVIKQKTKECQASYHKKTLEI